MNLIEKIAGNKTIANIAFKQIKDMIKKENISMLVIYVDNNGDVAAKQYNEPMVILKQSDYEKLVKGETNL